jgi:hypothetical protein
VDDHPGDEREQRRRPDPAERGERRGAGREDEERRTRQRHRGGGDRRPALRPVSEAGGEDGQQAPAEGEPEQDRRGDDV